jgi:hypothetical protein
MSMVHTPSSVANVTVAPSACSSTLSTIGRQVDEPQVSSTAPSSSNQPALGA